MAPWSIYKVRRGSDPLPLPAAAAAFEWQRRWMPPLMCFSAEMSCLLLLLPTNPTR